MKVGRHFILISVSLFVIIGTVLRADEIQKLSSYNIDQRDALLQGVFFTELVMSDLNYAGKLEGIREIQVWVEELPQEAKRYGLTRQALQTDIELRLRQFGIKVITQQQVKRRSDEKWKRDAVYLKRMFDLLQAEDYEEALKQLKEPHKSLLYSLNEEESDQRFLEGVAEYIKHSIPREDETPALHINVLPGISEHQKGAVVSISVELQTSAILIRGSSQVIATAVLWNKGGLMTCGLDNLRSEVREIVRDYTDEFINDYLAANPEHQLANQKNE